MIDKEYEESPEGLRERIAELQAELATARAELDRIHGVVLEMHNAARGEIYTKGAAAGAWAETVNRLGFSADAKRGAHAMRIENDPDSVQSKP